MLSAYSMDTEQRQTKTTELQLLAAPAQHSLHRLTRCGLGQSQGIGFAAQCRQGAGSASFAAATWHDNYIDSLVLTKMQHAMSY